MIKNIKTELDILGVKVRRKSESKLMKFISFFLGKKFMEHFYTTIGKNTIWAPSSCDLNNLQKHAVSLSHELVHIGQIRKYWLLFHIAFLFLPVPIFFAWFRWKIERDAYLVQIRNGYPPDEIEWAIDTLWNNYGWCWPKPLMRKWFNKNYEIN